MATWKKDSVFVQVIDRTQKPNLGLQSTFFP
jgi:hypothetical protein